MIAGLISIIIYAFIIALVIGLILYLLQSFPLPEPFNRFIRMAIVVVGVLILILLLLNLIEGGNIPIPRL